MLVLSRRENESVIIDGEITVRVLGVKGSRVRLGINAPASVPILRDELVVDLDDAGSPIGFAALASMLETQS